MVWREQILDHRCFCFRLKSQQSSEDIRTAVRHKTKVTAARVKYENLTVTRGARAHKIRAQIRKQLSFEQACLVMSTRKGATQQATAS